MWSSAFATLLEGFIIVEQSQHEWEVVWLSQAQEARDSVVIHARETPNEIQKTK